MFSATIAFGLAAALAWGVADFIVARAGQRLGALTTYAYVQLFGLLAVAVAMVVLGRRPDVGGGYGLVLLGIALVGAVGYLLLYASLAIGPVAVASPIASTYGGVAAVLGVVVLGEPLGFAGVAGLALVTVGVLAASMDLGDLRSLLGGAGATPVLPGATLAAVAALLAGSTLFFLDSVAGVADHLTAILVIRAVGTAISVPILAAPARRAPRADLPRLAVAGVLDAAAFVAFVVGLTVGRVAVVSPISSLFAVVTVVLAWVYLNESLSTPQLVGIGLVLVGVPLLASG